MTIGTELTRLGAKAISAEVQGHILCVVDVAACVARMWHELGAVDLDVELGDVDLGKNNPQSTIYFRRQPFLFT